MILHGLDLVYCSHRTFSVAVYTRCVETTCKQICILSRAVYYAEPIFSNEVRAEFPRILPLPFRMDSLSMNEKELDIDARSDTIVIRLNARRRAALAEIDRAPLS